LYADTSKIQSELGWQPKYGLEDIVKKVSQELETPSK